MKKTFVISFQKSGTYLISEILENLGYGKTLIHIDRFLGNTHQSYEEIRNTKDEINFRRSDFEYKADKLINNLTDNNFAVGHIYHSPIAKKIFKDHKIILTQRNIKRCLISMMNFLEESKRMTETDIEIWHRKEDQKEKFFYFLKLRGSGFINNCINILPWINENLLIIKFENIVDPNKNINEVKKISDYLNIGKRDYKKILEKSFEKKTLTKSSKDSSIDHYWSKSAENLFDNIGGNIINKKLGY